MAYFAVREDGHARARECMYLGGATTVITTTMLDALWFLEDVGFLEFLLPDYLSGG